MWRNLNLTFKINMPLPIDVGKGVVRGGRPNSVYGLSYLSHHCTESVLLKKLSDVVKETLAKMVKEIKSNLQNKHTAANWCWLGGGAGQGAKLSLWAEFCHSHVVTATIEMNNIYYSYKICKKCNGPKNSPQSNTRRCLLMLARQWCRAGGQNPSMGWVSSLPMVGP